MQFVVCQFIVAWKALDRSVTDEDEFTHAASVQPYIRAELYSESNSDDDARCAQT